jgi:sugar phosphate isomerase/epimerase
MKYQKFCYLALCCILMMLTSLSCGHLPGQGLTPSPETADQKIEYSLFAMDNCLTQAKDLSLPQQIDLLAELGYAGLSTSDLDHIDEITKELDRCNLKLFAVYFDLHIDPDASPWDPRINELILKLKGRSTVLWPNVQSKKWKPSDPAGDKQAVKIIRCLADLAARTDLKIALYPHAGLWIETTGDAVRIVEKLNRPNVGVTFNLCHWLKVQKNTDLRQILRSAGPRLWMATTDGADAAADDWPGLIHTLDRGDFDQLILLRELKNIGYTGPIGLQCYGVPGSPRDNLTRSMNAWRNLFADKTR